MYIYVDVVFCINIIMNTIILLTTAWLARISYVWWRVLLAAAWGAVYVIGGVMPQLALFYTPVFKLV
jgi:stage II sporulation protein GA (sporulation sigma-E factor processing peptidase)